jgi:hypothetical protein
LAHSDKTAPSGRRIYATEGKQFCPNGLAPACVTLGQKTACPVFVPWLPPLKGPPSFHFYVKPLSAAGNVGLLPLTAVAGLKRAPDPNEFDSNTQRV